VRFRHAKFWLVVADGCGRATARSREIATLGITIDLFYEYGPAQRLYGTRGYIPEARAHAVYYSCRFPVCDRAAAQRGA
jgi:hypothetical protein